VNLVAQGTIGFQYSTLELPESFLIGLHNKLGRAARTSRASRMSALVERLFKKAALSSSQTLAQEY
jgi:hypothetical protein